MSHPDVTERQRLQSNMFNFNMLLSALTLTLLAVSVESWLFGSSSSGSSTNNFDYDDNLSGSDLTNLYNSPVYFAERMKRPLGSSSFIAGPISHSGVRVTLANGRRWLIHKGGGYGASSQTVVTTAANMSPAWKVVTTGNFQGRKTVGDFVATGGSDYNFLFANCHWASIRMMNQ